MSFPLHYTTSMLYGREMLLLPFYVMGGSAEGPHLQLPRGLSWQRGWNNLTSHPTLVVSVLVVTP
jgi:hypothetical protein